MSEHDTYVHIAELEAEVEELAVERVQCEDDIRRLIEAEAAGEGSRAGEIHQLKQRKMMLATQMQHLRAKASALKLGII